MNNSTLKRKTFGGIFWKFSERFLAQGISLIVSILLARRLSAYDYAPISIAAIFFAFANIIISGGLNTALLQKKDADEKDYSTVLAFSVTVSIIVYALIFFLAPNIAKLYDSPVLTPVFRVMGLILVVNAVKSAICAYISSNLMFRKFFFATLGGTLISAVLGIFMAYKGFGVWALVAQQMSNSIVDTVILFLTTKIWFPFRIYIDRLKSLFGYGAKMLAASFVSTLYEEISPLVIGLKFTTADLSYYEKGKSFPSLINSAFNDSVSAVVFPAMAKVQDDKEKVLAFTRRFMGVSSFLIFPLMIGFFSVSDQFVLNILTEKWMGASVYIKVFCVCFMFNIVQNGNLQAIKAIGRSDIVLRMEILKKSLYIIVLLTAIMLAKSPVWIAVASIVNTVIATMVNTYPNRKLIGYSYKMQIQDLLPNLISAVIMGGVIYPVDYLLGTGNIFAFLIKIIVGMVVYFVLSVISKNPNLQYLFDLVKLVIGGNIREHP